MIPARFAPRRALAWVVVVAALAAGCSRSVDVPYIDAKAAAAAALAEYDGNNDGYLDGKELERCPGLKSALTQFDKNKDGRLSRTEIEEGLDSIQAAQVGLMEVSCKVTLGGKPLSGADVVMEPESFQGSSVKPAKGTTNESGRARMAIDGAPQPGCNVGLYRVRITKSEGGRELIPARYNAETKLGMGVGSGVSPKGINIFHLITP